ADRWATRPVVLTTGGDVFVDTTRFHTRLCQGIVLQIEYLGAITFGDTDITDQHHTPSLPAPRNSLRRGEPCLVFWVGFSGAFRQARRRLASGQAKRSVSWRHPYGQAREGGVVTQERFLSKRQRYQPISLPQDFA